MCQPNSGGVSCAPPVGGPHPRLPAGAPRRGTAFLRGRVARNRPRMAGARVKERTLIACVTSEICAPPHALTVHPHVLSAVLGAGHGPHVRGARTHTTRAAMPARPARLPARLRSPLSWWCYRVHLPPQRLCRVRSLPRRLCRVPRPSPSSLCHVPQRAPFTGSWVDTPGTLVIDEPAFLPARVQARKLGRERAERLRYVE